MKESSKYLKIVEWSEIDRCFVGSCPELFYGGCHGNDEIKVFKELCEIIDETVKLYKEDKKNLPLPISGKELVIKLQHFV